MLAPQRVRDSRELLTELGRTAASIVVVDLDPQPRLVLGELERIVAQFPLTRFVALATALESELLLEAMQAGVRRVLAKDKLRADLPAILDRLSATGVAAAATVAPGRQGKLLTVLSASGGCGATTLAVNLAEELALQQKEPSLLIDLDRAYGAVSTYLGIEPPYAMDHVLDYGGTIDPNLISSTAAAHPAGRLHVLASPASTHFSDPAPVKFERLEQMVSAARQAYASVVIDAPRVSIDVAARLVRASTQAFLVLQLTVKDIRTARSMMDALGQRDVPQTGVLPLANRYARRQMIGLDEAAKVLGVSPVLVHNDYAAAIQGLNFGRPLADGSPRSVIRRDLQGLLATVAARTTS